MVLSVNEKERAGLTEQEVNEYLSQNKFTSLEDPDFDKKAMLWKKDKLTNQTRAAEKDDAVSQTYNTLGNINKTGQQELRQNQVQAMKGLQLNNSSLSKYLGAGTSGMMNSMLTAQQPMMQNKLDMGAATQNMQFAGQQLSAREQQRQLQDKINMEGIKASYNSQEAKHSAIEDMIAQNAMDSAGNKGLQRELNGDETGTIIKLMGGKIAVEYQQALKDVEDGRISVDEFNQIRWKIKNSYEFRSAQQQKKENSHKFAVNILGKQLKLG